ncbi:MAG: peptide chain release factor 2 [Oscillospiraceae bacterium]|jgi:peptide chain release factor 2|nr:peptide chain release factor 2 [Oscillospiraceae bacterium]
MLQFDELRLALLAHKPKLAHLKEALALDAAGEEILSLEAQSADAHFWDDMQNSKAVLQRVSRLKSKIADYESLASAYEDALVMIELADEEEDLGLLEECQSTNDAVVARLDAMTLSTLLSGEYDAANAILTFHAGAGGTEAQDWNAMLVRMYQQWGQKNGFSVKMLDFLDGEEAGFKSCVLSLEGENAYGYLKGENGVHRLVRCSPFDSSGRRHTSFASLEVMPVIDDTIEVELNPDDIQIDYYRASGAGGQKVNKTSSAVRLTHLPSGIVVNCQVERSQHQNREVCMKMLKSKLIQIKEKEHLEKIDDIKGVKMEIGWGSQIRSYVFMPYQLAKDHRTGFENGNIQAVMDGELNGFINAYLKQLSISGEQ